MKSQVDQEYFAVMLSKREDAPVRKSFPIQASMVAEPKTVKSAKPIKLKAPKQKHSLRLPHNPNLPVCAQFKEALLATSQNLSSFAKFADLQLSNVCSAYHLNLKVSPKMLGKMQKAFDLLGYKCDVSTWFANRASDMNLGDYRTSTYAFKRTYVTHPSRQHFDDVCKAANVSRQAVSNASGVNPSVISDLMSRRENRIGLRPDPYGFKLQKGFARFDKFLDLEKLFPETYDIQPEDVAGDTDFYAVVQTDPARAALINRVDAFAKRELSELEYEAIQGKYFNGDSYQAIAAKHGVSPKSVDNAILRGLGKLRNQSHNLLSADKAEEKLGISA